MQYCKTFPDITHVAILGWVKTFLEKIQLARNISLASRAAFLLLIWNSRSVPTGMTLAAVGIGFHNSTLPRKDSQPGIQKQPRAQTLMAKKSFFSILCISFLFRTLNFCNFQDNFQRHLVVSGHWILLVAFWLYHRIQIFVHYKKLLNKYL